MAAARSPFHAGERAVQARAGVETLAARLTGAFRDRLPKVAKDFLASQRLAVAASVDLGGRVWASLLAGPPGFLSAPDGGGVEPSESS